MSTVVVVAPVSHTTVQRTSPEHCSNYLPRGAGDVTKHEQRGGGRSVISEQVLISTISIQKTVLCASWEESLNADLALTR